MFSKVKTSHLLIAFAVLLGVFLLVKRIDDKKGDRSFKGELVKFELEDVSKVTIYPKHGQSPMVFYQKDGHWVIGQNGNVYNAAESSVKNFTNALNSIVPERIAAISKDKWKKYEVTDSAGIRVVVEGNKKVLSDVMIGRFNYSMPKQDPNAQQNPYQQQQRGKMTSFVRLTDEKEVYAVDGFLSMNFDREARNFRDQTVIKGNKNNWTKITVTHPGDSSFVVEKVNGKWMMNNMPADSTSVDVYLGGLRDIVCAEFSNYDVPANPEHTILIEGNMDAPIKVTAAFDGDNYLLTSSQNVGSLFVSKPDAFFAKIFGRRPKLAK